MGMMELYHVKCSIIILVLDVKVRMIGLDGFRVILVKTGKICGITHNVLFLPKLSKYITRSIKYFDYHNNPVNYLCSLVVKT